MMKLILSLAVLLQGVSAFPFVLETLGQNGALDKRATGGSGCSVSSLCNSKYPVSDAQIGYNPKSPTAAQQASAARNHCGVLCPCTMFNAEEQLVSVSGEHAYQAPRKTDIRGPCPGLSAAANHGYLSRNGVQTLAQTITGLGEAWGMSVDLAGFLAAYAIAIDGDVLSLEWSIGGPPPTPNVLGKAQGISWSHNKYEGDTSIGRCDAYINDGDAHSLSTTKFAYAMSEGIKDDRLDMDKFARAMAKNTHRSIGQNPYYFTGLFSTTLVAPAAYNFVIAFMSNHTAAEPDGYLNEAMFKQFFGISGDYPNYTWEKGQESIPQNWYRRPSSQPYTASGGVFGDLIAEFAAYPDTFRFGGNTKGTNSYTGIDISNFSNGVYNSKNLLEGNNLACFMYQNIQQGLPDVVNTSPFANAGLALVEKYFGIAFPGLSCPQVSKFNNNNLPPFAGRSYTPTAPYSAAVTC